MTPGWVKATSNIQMKEITVVYQVQENSAFSLGLMFAASETVELQD